VVLQIKGETAEFGIELKLLQLRGNPSYVDPSGGVVGGSLGALGLYVFSSWDGAGKSGFDAEAFFGGILLVGAGIPPSVVGWRMFANAGTFSLDREALDEQAAKGPRSTLGVAALTGGGGLGASFNF
jgi:hypothetical protein